MNTLRALALLLLPAIAFAAGVPPFPFTEYPPARQVQPACHGPALAADLSDDWIGLSSETRDVFIHLTNGEPDYVYFAVGTVGNGPVVQRVLPIAEAKVRYPDLCTYFTEEAA